MATPIESAETVKIKSTTVSFSTVFRTDEKYIEREGKCNKKRGNIVKPLKIVDTKLQNKGFVI